MPPQNPALDYYYERYKSRRSDRPVAQINPVDGAIDEMRDRRIRQSLLRGGSPDVIGRATTLSRELDVEPLLLEDRIGEAERGRDVRRFMSMTERYPAIGKWAVQQPRAAATAVDDFDSLSLLGKAWRTSREIVTGIGPSLSAGLFSAAESMEGAVGAVSDVFDAIDPKPAVAGFLSDIVSKYIGYNPRWDKSFEESAKISATARANRRAALKVEQNYWRPQSTSWIARGLLQGTESTPLSLMALLTRDPKAASGVMGAVVGGGEYQNARDRGLDIGSALAYGARQGAVEAITEHMPARQLLLDVAAKSPFAKMFMSQLARELPGEQVATFLQDFDQWVTLNPEKTLGEFKDERWDAAVQTALATIGGVGSTTLTVKSAEKFTDGIALLAGRRAEAAQARVEGAVIDDLATAATGKLAQRDPEGFANLLQTLGREGLAEDIYISADGVREFLQSGNHEAEGPWADYVEQFIESAATGGDVVIPTDTAMRDLANTPEWRELAKHMRLGPGGMSRAEAETFDAEQHDLDSLVERDNPDAAAERASAAARETIVADVVAKLKRAGYMPSVAQTQAELIASRYVTRAARTGQELTGAEFGAVQVVQVLPDQLAKAQKDNRLDRVIEVMRRDAKRLASGKQTTQADKTDPAVRSAATELATLLTSAGLDPASARRSEIRSAIAARPDASGFVPAGVASRREYQQGGTGQPRGKITFPGPEFTGAATIQLFKGRNLSTFLHESGHLWLEELRADASARGATEQLRDDWATVQRWFAENGHPIAKGVIPVDAHEMWARGVERYMMEGRAPTQALRSTFEKFRSWLVGIYRNVRALKAPISPEIRRVMDRLIATDEELSFAAKQQEMSPLLTDPSDMTKAEYQAYVKLTADARSEARAALLDKTASDIRARETQRYKDLAAQVRGEIAASVDERPAFRALAAMKATPVNRRWIVDHMGDEAALLMPRGVPPLMNNTGVHPDMIAEMTGFGSGREMIEAIITMESAHRMAREEGDARGMRDRVIEEELGDEMRRRYGDPLTDGSIEQEALAAIHSDKAGEVIAAEARVLGRKSGNDPTPYAAARNWAREKIRQGRVSKEAMPGAMQRYARAARRSARRAEEAYLAQDVEEAFRAKQQQMLNNALYAEAKKAHDEVEVARSRMHRIASKRAMKGVDQSYLDQAHALLEAVDLKQRTMLAVDRKAAFDKWLASRAEGEEVLAPQSLDWTGTNWTKLSVEALLGLDDSVSSIIHLGRMKRTLLDNKAKRDFEDWRGEALRGIEATPGRKITNELGDPSRPIAGLFSNLMKMEVFAGEMDNGAGTGVWQRLLVERGTEAANYRDQMRDEILKPITAVYNALPRKMRDRLAARVTVPEMLWRSPDPNDPRNGSPLEMTRWDIVGMALNLGTESNLDKLARGYGISEAVAENIVRRELSQEEWRFVQGVWDALDLLRPHIAKVEREMTGLEPEWLDPRPVETPFGVLKGGYYPVKYDPSRSQRAEDNDADSMNDLFGSRSGVATHKGHTVTRTEYVAPLLLSPEQVLFSHVEKIITRNAYAPWLRDVLKAVKDASIRAAIDRKFGAEFRQQIEPWLRAQVREGLTNEQGTHAVERWLRSARINVTVVSMGLRWSTGVAQTIGLANSIGRVGVNNMRRGFQRMLANPSAAAEFVFSRSPEMARRNEAMNRDVSEAFRQMRKVRLSRNAAARTASTWQAKAQAFAFWHIGMIDRYVVSIPTWLGAYERATRQGMDDVAASKFADRAVRLSQGSGREKDLSAWQSSQASNGLKFFTMFYTPFNVLLNTQWEAGRAARRGDYRKAATLAFWYMIATPLLDALLAGDAPTGDDDDEAWATWLARNIGFYLAAGIPIVRDGANYAERKMTGKFATFSSGPLSRIFEGGEDALTLAWDATLGEDEVSDRWVKTAIETPGYFLGLPTGQVSSTAQFMADVNSGRADPEGFWDWYNGLTKGRIDK